MRLTAALDISTFIWCEQDFKMNSHHYYTLLGSISTVYDKIKELKLPMLFSMRLQDLIWNEFPYNMARKINPDFEISTLRFLTETISNWVSYDDRFDCTLTTIPVLFKPHFNRDAIFEYQRILNNLFHDELNQKFIIFNYFYNHNANLVLRKEDLQKEIETLIYSSDKDIIQFFDRYKIRFEHNPKHTDQVRYANGEKISPFSCFHQPNGHDKAQQLLDEAFLYENHYYHFDIENGVFIKFVLTSDLTYHGFDLSDSDNNVPNEVKKKFNKHGKIF